MKRLLLDMSSICWMSLLAGKDKENGVTVEHEGRDVFVNSASYGYENAMQHILATMKRFEVVPKDMILVLEGHSSKILRKTKLPQYKESRSTRPAEAYEQFNLLKEKLAQAFLDVGAHVVTQDNVEADDILAYLAQHLDGEKIIVTSDGDLAVLVQDGTHIWRREELDQNPYGPFSHKHISVYKALVGDTSDNIPGAKGFGEKAFLDLLVAFGEEGLEALTGLLESRTLHMLHEDVAELKSLQKVLDSEEQVYASWYAAKLHPEWVNTLRKPLEWRVGMVKPLTPETDERLKPWAGQTRLVTKANYAAAVSFLKSKVSSTPYFSLDLETTVPDESDDWLAQRTKNGGGVDVIASSIVGCGIAFGDNLQYAYYISVGHADTDNVKLGELVLMLEEIPKDKFTVAHNAAGFELPVMYNNFGHLWTDNGWRGFFPNMVDSRIAASYWDENQPSHGLKQLSKLLLGYEQTSYADVTQGRKMDQMTAAETVAYGVDDVYTCAGLWNHFALILGMEKSLDAFMTIEQKPMYLSALSFVKGNRIDMEKLKVLEHADDTRYEECSRIVDAYLISKGWMGTVCPTYTELTAKAVKEVVEMTLGVELETRVRTVSKMAPLIRELNVEGAEMLAGLIEDENLDGVQSLVNSKFDGKPILNVGSNKQLTDLLYTTMGLPIRLRNKATDTMRKAGIYEGNPRADDEAMAMAIKMGDAQGEVADVLKALTDMKSINTKRGLYWAPYPRFIHWRTGRIHPEIRQCSTNTRRHTGANPNFQQMDSAYGGVRSVILPHHKDAVIVSCDLAGQEIRLLADMSRDGNMMSAYMGEDLKDLHSFTAAMILGVSYEDFRASYKSEDKAVADKANAVRQSAKTVFFASSYGAMAPKIAEGLGITETLAKSYLDALDRAFPRVGEWKEETEKFAQKHGWVPIHGGNRRHLRQALLADNKWEAQKALRQASNARIQGAGGNQIRTIMTAIWDSDLIEAYDFHFYWPCHDEVVFSVGKEDAAPAIQKLHSFMCQQFLDVLPSASSIGIGASYGELVEIGEVADGELIGRTVDDIFDVGV
jgi:DNA polymerase I-like protein with 3'-5' exonuclease and polymerase domains/5'-3' exonuclease